MTVVIGTETLMKRIVWHGRRNRIFGPVPRARLDLSLKSIVVNTARVIGVLPLRWLTTFVISKTDERHCHQSFYREIGYAVEIQSDGW